MARDDIVMVAATAPGLAIKLFFSYLRMKRKAKKAAKRFRKELIRSGVERETATMLAEEYRKSTELFSITNLGRMMVNRAG
jgi:hypothetical protein